MVKFTNDLLKEAIADAEVLQKTAIANAKLTLEESFAPQIKSMIAMKLRNESDPDEWYNDDGPEPFVDEDEDPRASLDEDEEDVDEASDPHVATKADSFGKVEEAKEKVEYNSSGVGSAGDSGIHSDEGLPQGATKGPDASLTSSDIGNDSETSGKEDRGAAKGDKTGGEYYHGDGPEPFVDEAVDLEEAFSLQDIIRELERDVAALSELGVEDGEEDMDMDFDDGGDDAELDMSPDGEMDFDDGGDDSLDIDMGDDDGADMGDMDMDLPDDDEDDIDLEEILREIEAEAEVNESAQVATENVKLKKELKEHRAAVQVLHTRLNEVNLLNAKLLYTNKLFRAGLSEQVKVRIVEQFDRATTLREVKLLYSALAETIVESRRSSKSRKKASSKETLAEGIASRAGGSTAPQKVITEQTNSDSVVDAASVRRLQQLAGINY